MATALDLLLVDQFTAGINAPGPLDDGKMARVAVDDSGRANLEYVSITVGLDGANVKDYGAIGNGTIDDSAAISAAFASGEDLVYFPPGTYKIGTNITASAADQTIRMAPGATLSLAAGIGATFSGARQTVENLDVAIATTSSATYSAAVVSGAESVVRGAKFNVTADVANATLLQLAADDVTASDVFIKSDSRFLRGVSMTTVADASPLRCIVNGLRTDIAPSTSKQLGSLVNSHSSFGVVRDLSITTGANVTFSEGVIRQRASNFTLHNPYIFCVGAQYGVYGADSASEKLTIFGGQIQGRNNATYVAGSEGLRVGHQSGHQKIYGTFINGWENGVVFHGSADSPGFYSAIIANNQNYAFVIDAGAGVGAVRGFNVIDCYLQDVTQKYTLHCVSGKLEGFVFSGCEIGFDDVAILVDSGFDGFEGGIIQGCFIQGGSHGATALGVLQPNVNASNAGTLFLSNKLQGAGTIGYGTYAAKAIDVFDPPLTGVTIGTSGTRVSKHFVVSQSVDFSAAIATPNGYIDRTVTVTGVAVGDSIHVTIPDDVVYPGDMYFWWLVGTNQVKIRRMNNGDWTSTAGTGTVRVDVWKH